jgi:hypothetical protein
MSARTYNWVAGTAALDAAKALAVNELDEIAPNLGVAQAIPAGSFVLLVRRWCRERRSHA